MSRSRTVFSLVLCFAIGLLTSQSVHAQGGIEDESAASAPTGAKKRIRFEPELKFSRIGLEQGLPQTHVVSIAQDDLGYIWFATQEGLARYDGHRMIVYTTSDGLPANYISAIAPAKGGSLWIGTEKGLAYYNAVTDRFDTIELPQVEQLIATMLTVGDDVWFGSSDGMVGHLITPDQPIDIFPVIDTLGQPVAITALAQFGSDLLVGTQSSGILQTDGKKVKGEYLIQDFEFVGTPILSMVVQEKDLWIGTQEEGLVKVREGESPVVYRHDDNDPSSLVDDRVSALAIGGEGLLWVGTLNGVARLWTETGVFDNFHPDLTNPSALPFPYVTTLLIDSTGILWTGTFAGGLCYLDSLRTRFSFYLSQTTATAFLEKKNGDLWIGTYPATLSKANRKEKYRDVLYQIELDTGEFLDISPFWLTQIREVPDGKLWLSLYGKGVMLFDPATEIGQLFTEEDIEGLQNVWAIEAGPDKSWLFATFGGGLAMYDGVKSWSAVEGLPASLYSIHLDLEQGEAWVGSADDGLFRLDLDGSATEHYTMEDGLSNAGVTTIEKDENGILWLGTYGGGLNRFDPKTKEFKVYTSEKSGSSSAYGILLDTFGRSWLSTNGGGIIRFDPKTESITSFSTDDGALAEYGQASYYRSAVTGNLFFGGFGGFVYFDPKTVDTDKDPAPIVLTGFSVFNKKRDLGKPIWLTESIGLKAEDSVVSFQFASLAYASPRARRYKYKLKGVHSDWIETDQPSATYSSLDPGDYTFTVMGSNRHGVWSEPISLKLVVAPPWYLTWYAYTFYGFCALGVIYLFVRWQTARVEAAKQANRLGAVERDLELTGAIQSGCLPAVGSIRTGLCEIEAFYRAADQCSGDWWWYEKLSPTRQILFVGDVTGHGPGPAMVTASVAAAQRTQSRIPHSSTMEERITILNEEVLRSGLGKYQMTLTVVEFEENTGEFWVYAAGGLPPITLSAEGKSRTHPCRGTPLGTADHTFHIGTAKGMLQRGERLILFTDGVPEIEMSNGRQIGMRRFSKLWGDSVTLPLAKSIGFVTSTADKMLDNRAQDDDWTIVALDYLSVDKEAQLSG